MTNQLIEKIKGVATGIVIVIAAIKMLQLDDNTYSGAMGSLFGVVLLFLGIFIVAISIGRKTVPAVWSEKNIRIGIISHVIAFLILWLIPPRILLGDLYGYIGNLYVIVKNMIIAESTIGLICSVLHISVNKNTQIKLKNESNKTLATDAVLCVKCGKSVNDNSVFCAHCGEKISKIDGVNNAVSEPNVNVTVKLCPSCNNMVESDDVFCVNCGSKLTD